MLVYLATTLSLLFTLDQARLVWLEHNAAGVSPLSWSFYTLSSLVWFAYGYVHRDRIILTTQFLWVIVNLTVALGVFIYR